MHFSLKEWAICKDFGGLYLTKESRRMIIVKKAIKGIFKKVLAHILKTGSILTFPAPVEIFSPYSFTELLIEAYLTFAPRYLTKAASIIDPFEQMKLCAAM